MFENLTKIFRKPQKPHVHPHVPKNQRIYAIGDIPNEVDPALLAVVIASAIAACLFGAFFPGIQAVQKSPIDILRVDQL